SSPNGLGAGPVGGNGTPGAPGQFVPLLAVALAAAGGFFLFGIWRRRRKPGDEPDAPLPVTPPPPAPVAPAIVLPTAPPALPPAPKVRRLRRPGKPVVEGLTPEVGGAAALGLALDGTSPDEATLPRWRRPSLKAARLASDRKPVETVPLAFGAAVAASVTNERRVIRYAVVPLVDAPDEIRSTEIGQLQQGDEVELLASEGRWMRVRTPVGSIGWVHKTTLAPLGTTLQPAALLGDADPAPEDAPPDADGAGLLDQAIQRATAFKLDHQPPAEPAPKPRRASRRRGTAPAG
ncbi:MAG TPA: SH3 domain-containing protein, partial [Candidatus Sulfotelmatobacter sp.]|nr:SH3 domain-containing protein [Candidatus Sulfotelmatobacter sp.]